MGVHLFCHDSSERVRENGLKLPFLGRVRLDIRRIFFAERVVRHWNNLPRNVVESLSLEVLKRRLDVAFGDMV